MFDLFGDFFSIASRSRRRLRDVSISCGEVAETNFVRDYSATSLSVAARSRRLILSATKERSPRRLRDLSETCWRPRRLRRRCGDCRRRRGDVPATSGKLVATLSGDVSETSPWRRLGESASHFLVSRVARVAATEIEILSFKMVCNSIQ